MFIKRNRRRAGDAAPTSVLLVQGERIAVGTRPRGRPRKDARPLPTRVVHRVLANLSHLPPDLVALIEDYCKGRAPAQEPAEPCVGPCYGVLGALRAVAEEIGLTRVLGEDRRGRLALFLVLARMAHRGSRLSAVRWAQDHAVAEVLGLARFDEDDLYETLDWLAAHQTRMEVEMARSRPSSALFLYDVTSSYLEGQKNELAAPGYNRDGKRFKKQVVVGLLTDAAGEPVAVRVYRGNTADPKTVGDPVRLLAEELGVKDVVFVGDRGMLKSAPRAEIAAAGFRFLTALTEPQVRALLRGGQIQLGLFEEKVAEVTTADGRRLLLRMNRETRDRDRQRRADQMERVRSKLAARNAHVREHPRADPAVSLRLAQGLLQTYRLDRFAQARLEGREARIVEEASQRADVELLDGCYVLETDVPVDRMDRDGVHARYMDLAKVERDFRTMKTGLLELRPIHLRKASRTRGHAFVTMLALRLARAIDARLRGTGLCVQDALDRLAGVRLVTVAEPSLGLWRLPIRHAPAQREILDRLPPLPAPALSRTRSRAVAS